MMIKQVKYLLFFLTHLLLGYESIAQTILLDSKNKSSIAFAHIVSETGKLLVSSDINGVIDLSKVKKSKSNIFTIQHIAYADCEIKSDSLYNKKIIKLTPRSIKLPAFTLTNSTPDYLVLKGFFRSYQTENNIPKYFMDGIIEYYIPIKKNKRVKRKVIEYRVYKNKRLIAEEKKRGAMMVLDIVGTPYLSKSIVTDRFEKKYTLEDSLNFRLIKKGNISVGTVQFNVQQNKTYVNLNMLAPKKEKVGNIFGYTQKMVKYNVSENYTSEALGNLFKENLISRSVYRKFYFKHKKDKDFKKIDGITEFYVLDKKFINKTDFKEIDFSILISKKSSNYSTDYWKDVEIKLPESIENLLGKELQLCN